MLVLILSTLVVLLSYCNSQNVTATCNLFGYDQQAFVGQVNFTQMVSENLVYVRGCLRGIPQGKHGFHVHQFGAIENNCMAAGGHFNPEHKSHGDITDVERHVGDLGNLDIQNSDYFCFPEFSDDLLSLLPGRHSIIGRVLAVHRDEDDLGRGSYPDSHTTGHSGPRIACCVIGLTSDVPTGGAMQFVPHYGTLVLCLLTLVRGFVSPSS